MNQKNRKIFWIDPPLQLEALGVVLLVVMSSLLIVFCSAFKGLADAAARSGEIYHSLEWVRQSLRGPVVISSLVSLLSATLVTLIWSHRFAGPLRVLSAAIARVRQGHLASPVRVRETDAHQELVAEFAAMQETLRERLGEDRRFVEELSAELSELGRKAGEPHHKDLARIAEKLRTVGSRFDL